MSQPLDEVRSAIEAEGIVLLLSSSGDTADVSLEAVKAYQEVEDGQIVYITTAKPHSRVSRRMADAGIDPEGILFIDTTTDTGGATTEDVIVMRPEDLTAMSITISTAVDTVAEDAKRVLIIFDTLSGLTVYNTESIITRFIQNLSTRIQDWGADAAYIMLESDSEQFRNRVASFADRTVTVED